jgi:hypothetical protein
VRCAANAIARFFSGYGQTELGRYLTVIADHEGEGWFFVVTARDMTSEERRGYRKNRSKK